MSISNPKNWLDRNVLEDEDFLRGVIFYKREGLSLDEIVAKIEKKYILNDFSINALDLIYNNA